MAEATYGLLRDNANDILFKINVTPTSKLRACIHSFSDL